MFSCHKGYGGIINDFLSWKAFLPLSKLTFAAYLNHIILQCIVFYSQTSSLYFTDFLMSQYFIGIMCFTFGIAFIQTITLESPFVNLEKILLSGGPKSKKNVLKKPQHQMNGSAKERKQEEKEADKKLSIIEENSKELPIKEQETVALEELNKSFQNA